jgi:predicted dehydrogenase
LLGAGVFATNTLLPAIKKTNGVRLSGICAASGAHAGHAANKFGFRYSTTDEEQIIQDPGVNAIVIATRHHLHAQQVQAAMRAGKHVFCEKPLCLTEEELSAIVREYTEQAMPRGLLLMVGFNRRFAPMIVKMKEFLEQIHEPLALHYRVNPGQLPSDHWTNDPEQGGGRILGEVCHFIDLLTFLAGPPIDVHARALANPGQYSGDNVLITVQFANGSQGSITYVANGDRTYSKERLEVFGGGAVAVMDDFRSLELVRHGRKKRMNARFQQDKGHRGEWQAFAGSINDGKTCPIPFSEIVTSTLATLKAAESLRSGLPMTVDAESYFASLSPSLWRHDS